MVAQSSDRFSSMLAFFFVGLLVVTPYAVVRLRRMLRERAERHPGDGNRADSGPAEDAPVRSTDDLATVVEAIAAGAASGGTFWVRVPRAPLDGGRVVPEEVVRGVLADAVARSRVTVSERTPTGDGERWRCEGPQ